MPRLLMFHDFASAFCRAALPVVREAAAGAGLDLALVPFELFPAPTLLPEPADVLASELEAVTPWTAERGLMLKLPSRTPRTRKAHEAVAFARDNGLELAMAEAIYDALWNRGLDIGRLDVLGELGEEIGLDGAALHVALGVDLHGDAVADAQRAAEASGIESVPTLRFGESELVGLARPPDLAAWLISRGG